MEKIALLILSIILTSFVGITGYFVKTVHKEIKEFIKELTEYTHKLKQLIVGIQTQIDKSIETDIQELKTDVKELSKKVFENEKAIQKHK